MNAESLLASAAINIGLAFLVLILFSLLKKQPANAYIYYALPLSQQRSDVPPLQEAFSFRRFLPTFYWLRRAFRVTEDEILESSGLDALILIRLFKFGVKYFTACSLVGVFVLLPVNYTSQEPYSIATCSMDSFSISNIQRGSDRLWVHFACLWLISLYALYLLYKVLLLFFHLDKKSSIVLIIVHKFHCLREGLQGVLKLRSEEYGEMLGKRVQLLHENRHRPDQFVVLVREVPLCIQYQSRGCCVDDFFSKHYPESYSTYQMVTEEKDLENLLMGWEKTINESDSLNTVDLVKNAAERLHSWGASLIELRSLMSSKEIGPAPLFVENVPLFVGNNQAKAIMRKIESLRGSSRSESHDGFFLLRPFQEDTKSIHLLEEKLQQLNQRIGQLQHEDMLRKKELPVAFVAFKSRRGAALAAQSQQHSNPLVWFTENSPEPRDVIWKNLGVPYRLLPLYRVGIYFAAWLVTVFFAIPVTAVQGIARFEKLKKWFPPAMAIQIIPGLRSIVTGYLPSAILNGFIYVVPFAMLALAKLAGCVSRSREEKKTCNMVFYFLVGNVFFLSLLSGSLLDEIGESFTHPNDFPSHLASAVSSQVDFFMTYILTNGLSGFSLEILQPALLSWDLIKSHTYARGKNKAPYIYPLPYFRIIPLLCLFMLIGMVYAVVAPLLLPFLVGYYLLGYAVFINQIQDVYETIYETFGQFLPYINHYIMISIILMQVTMIGLFGLKMKPAASLCTIPLLLLTLMFNEYCKMRFLPSFGLYAIQNAQERDELDEKTGLRDGHEDVISAYRQPSLQPVDFITAGSSLTSPLLFSR